MPRKKKSLADTSAKVMRRKKPINNDQLLDISPLTPTQDKVFEEWTKDKNLCLYGAAGTGKTFVALYLALKSVLDENTPYEKIYIVRSLVATREIGFLPGDHDDKAHCIRFHIRTWFNTCLRWLLIQTLTFSMIN